MIGNIKRLDCCEDGSGALLVHQMVKPSIHFTYRRCRFVVLKLVSFAFGTSRNLFEENFGGILSNCIHFLVQAPHRHFATYLVIKSSFSLTVN